VAQDRRFDPAPDGRASQDQRRTRRVLREWEAITERSRHRALLEIHSEVKRGTRWLHHEGIFSTRAFGFSGAKLVFTRLVLRPAALDDLSSSDGSLTTQSRSRDTGIQG